MREEYGYNKGGMYCSRTFADWLLKMNDSLDFPAVTYYKLIRLFCRSQYRELLVEEERKGNDFCYHLHKNDEKLSLDSSYDLVFLPYCENIKDVPPIKSDKVVLGYRVLQTRGMMPGNPSLYIDEGYDSMSYIMEDYIRRPNTCKNLSKQDGVMIDTYPLGEFLRAEQKMFIDNEWPYSFGPKCPDRSICYHTYFNIINNLIEDIDNLKLISEKQEHYQIRLVSFAAAILERAQKGEILPGSEFCSETIYEIANDLYEHYRQSFSEDMDGYAEKIKAGRNMHTAVRIDLDNRCSDLDVDDLDTSPIGITEEDKAFFDTIKTTVQ